MVRRHAKALRRQAVWQLFLDVHFGLRRILVDGEFATNEAATEIETLRDRLHHCAPHLQDTAPHVITQIATAIGLIEHTRRHARQAAQRAAIDTVGRLGLLPADLPHLTSHLVLTATDIDTHSRGVHGAAARIIDTATRTAGHHPEQHRLDSAVLHVEQCLRAIDTVNAPLRAQALALLDTALKELTRIGGLPVDHHALPPPTASHHTRPR
ncbi:hypothetical protein [Micromonospora sp. WMMD1082]|uniref:hypothetical protein n=1 Tax=Micromonospora sp. WMMD1082 TaxID=3016104 RepID=UPI0024163EF4|nr:hypothetical protein [Micromonospora sp. WMMD1082]MDG4795208.1 hypothetical protein [Micromonospora sp. WMMD1082]